MKTYFALLAALLLSLPSLAQSPKRFSYQAVIRTSGQQLVREREVLVRVSILMPTTTGPAVYVEEHKPTTNENGLLTLQIGGGTVQQGVFDSIDWAKGPYFLETRVDPEGREITANAIVGVSQLLSVPYALYALQADSTRHALYADSVKGHQIGDLFGGGIIFAVWRDQRGRQHGLIASLMDLPSTPWATPEITSPSVGSSYQNGALNTLAIVGVRGSNTAAGVCDAYVALNGNLPPYTDWYLPATQELNLLYTQAAVISAILDTDNDPQTTGLNKDFYWSSTITVERDDTGTPDIENAWAHVFQSEEAGDLGVPNQEYQPTAHGVRAIRRF